MMSLAAHQAVKDLDTYIEQPKALLDISLCLTVKITYQVDSYADDIMADCVRKDI